MMRTDGGNSASRTMAARQRGSASRRGPSPSMAHPSASIPAGRCRDTGDEAALWAPEERFWTAGAAGSLDPACIMAFPATHRAAFGRRDRRKPGCGAALGLRRPDGAAHRASRAGVGRSRLPHARLADGAPAYAAVCTACYRATAAGWRLVQHQQTPAG